MSLQKRSSFRYFFVLLLLPCFTLLSSCARPSEASDAGPDAHAGTNATSTIVPVAKAGMSNLSDDLVLTGEFIPYQEIDVMAKEAGYIRDIRVDIGDRVKTGERIAQLEIPEMQDDIARSAAGVQAAEADISKAKGDMERAQSGYDIAELSYKRILDVSNKEPGLVPQQEVDVAHSKQLEAAGQLSASRSDLETAERKLTMAKAEQSRWTTLEKYTIISAPFTGVITKRYANTGAMIQQGTASNTQAMPVVRLSQNNLLRLILPVPESAVPSVHIGETVDVTVHALEKTFLGKITRFEDKVSTATRTMNTEVDVPNSNYLLVPGMYAEIRLRLSQRERVLTVPLDAMEETGDAAQVYAVQDSTVHILNVKTGLKTARQVEIRTGLKDGDLVIVGRHTGLEQGQKVTAKLVDFDAPSKTGQGS